MHEHALLRHRNANRREEQMSRGSGTSLQQAYDRVHHELRKGNHPEQETKSKKRPANSKAAETKEERGDTPHHKRQHVHRESHVGGQLNCTQSHDSRYHDRNRQQP
jgi:hypothetical protein